MPSKQLGDLDRVVVLGALEQQVLEEVRDALLPWVSSREPVRTQRPRATERTEETSSVTTRTPPSSSVRAMPSGRLNAGDRPGRHRGRAAAVETLAATSAAAASAAAVAAGAHRSQLLGALVGDRRVV